MGADNANIVLIHLARAADALEHTQEDDDPGCQEAEGQLPSDRTRVMKALTVYNTQHLLTTRHTSQTQMCEYNSTLTYTTTPLATPFTH